MNFYFGSQAYWSQLIIMLHTLSSTPRSRSEWLGSSTPGFCFPLSATDDLCLVMVYRHPIRLKKEPFQFQVMLGSGDPGTEQWMKASESAHKDKFRGWVGFNVSVSHRITAG